jgi:hypothetical protein
MKDAGALVLYLDYDGVLHHENVWCHPRKGAVLHAPLRHRLFQHVGLLERELAPFPDVHIVLSTSWVRRYGYSRSAEHLGPVLRSRTIGATYHSQMRAYEDAFAATPRGIQVLHDVARRRPRDWPALGDDALGWPPSCADRA